MQREGRKGKRTSNACIPCRHSKIKCSGIEPCSNCERRGVQCVFSDGNSKVIIAESYLRSLERQLREFKRAATGNLPPTPTSRPDRARRCSCAADKTGGTSPGETSPPPEAVGYARNIWTNPFTLPSATIPNTKQNKRSWIWLAPSSTWSFTARLTIMMSQTLEQVYPEDAPALGGFDIYPLRWTRSAEDEPPDIQDLPSFDYALYLFNIAKFHLGQNYCFFNEDRFVSRISDFYHGDAARIATEDRLWFIQLLLVFAFGKAFRSAPRSVEDPPGASFFTRAMSLTPDHTSLWKESVIAIEVLALDALYLYSVDQRESAHIYIGQAVRIAQFEGLHT